ncbi:hypothetical protein SB816_30450, partial [Achromobacter sp. SIMBA_011]|uniref:hypothetical protein n=1 Tax=Achromobacter sp. SIMBA_011 TaxID=3085759 RepID=UPI003978A2C6
GVDLTHIPKRLGDGFYEQQLVRNQVTSLTGRAVLGPYTDLQTMYQQLMAAGASLEKTLNLSLGASLSAEQVSQLTNNVIMMETRVDASRLSIRFFARNASPQRKHLVLMP